MGITDIYHYTLQQEVLKESAADEWNKLVNYMYSHNLSWHTDTNYSKLFWELAEFEQCIISDANNNDSILEEIRQKLYAYRKRVNELTDK